jgi:POT family proton-dependent oligopeptide transporter
MSEPAVDNRMPKGIPFIVTNEFAERFCFYGINSILTLYLVQHMHFGDAKAASWQSLFKMGAYFFPMLGAIISDVFWGKFKTIFIFSLVYAAGCLSLALFGHTQGALVASLLFVAIGTGGIKPCVSTNVGDQFTAKNQHLIEKAFQWFYFAINLGSSISIYLCPILLTPTADRPSEGWERWTRSLPEGPEWAFGMPAAMMLLATIVFIAGRSRYAHVPPAGKKWLDDIFNKDGVALIGRLVVIYFFVAMFWMLWDQSNGNTWTLQAQSSLMDKKLFDNFLFKYTILPGQIQVVNGLFILAMIPIFQFAIYPLMGRFFAVTPLRKIGIGLFTIASSFLIVAWIDRRIQEGHVVSAWWQIVAYVVLTASEILVSITALEFSYKQAPLRMKSFVMALFLLSTSLGNLAISAVNEAMIKPLHATAIQPGAQTWVALSEAKDFVTGQKIDVVQKVEDAEGAGVVLADASGAVKKSKEGKASLLAGTYLAKEIDTAGSRIRLMDVVERADVATAGRFDAAKTEVSTYHLVGPVYFYFFFGLMCAGGIVYVFFAMAYKEQTFVRTEDGSTPPSEVNAEAEQA